MCILLRYFNFLCQPQWIQKKVCLFTTAIFTTTNYDLKAVPSLAREKFWYSSLHHCHFRYHQNMTWKLFTTGMWEVLTLRVPIFIQPEAIKNSSQVRSHHSVMRRRNITRKQERMGMIRKEAIRIKHTQAFTIILRQQPLRQLGAGLT